MLFLSLAELVVITFRQPVTFSVQVNDTFWSYWGCRLVQWRIDFLFGVNPHLLTDSDSLFALRVRCELLLYFQVH